MGEVGDLPQGSTIAGDFTGSLQLCYRIKNGKIIGRMKDLSISGNIYKLLMENLFAVSLETSLDHKPYNSLSTFKAPYFYLRDVMIK